MAFRIHEITVDLMAGAPGPCMPASPDPACPGASCKNSTKPDDKPKPGGGDKPGGGKNRNLAALLAQLRATLAPSPL